MTRSVLPRKVYKRAKSELGNAIHAAAFCLRHRHFAARPVRTWIDRLDRKYNASRHAVEAQGAVVATRENLLPYKSSDTLYVLGSGASINDLMAEQWQVISRANSIGFNLFFAHDFVPTFYHMEFIPESFEIATMALQARRSDYVKTPLLVNYNHVDPNIELSRYLLGACTKFTLPSQMQCPVPHMLAVLQHYHRGVRLTKSNFIIHYRGSVTLLISLGVLLGYKKIVLLGVDLNNTDYFFHNEALFQSQLATKVRHWHLLRLAEMRATGEISAIHRTNDPNLFPGFLTIDAFLQQYKKVLEPLGTRLQIGSKNSALYPMLELADFQP
jgi:hypothetical protein